MTNQAFPRGLPGRRPSLESQRRGCTDRPPRPTKDRLAAEKRASATSARPAASGSHRGRGRSGATSGQESLSRRRDTLNRWFTELAAEASIRRISSHGAIAAPPAAATPSPAHRRSSSRRCSVTPTPTRPPAIRTSRSKRRHRSSRRGGRGRVETEEKHPVAVPMPRVLLGAQPDG